MGNEEGGLPARVPGLSGITSNSLVRSSQGSSVPDPTATGWDQELRARTAVVRLLWRGLIGHADGYVLNEDSERPGRCQANWYR